MSDLAPCPFCAAPALDGVVRVDPTFAGGMKKPKRKLESVKVECSNCTAMIVHPIIDGDLKGARDVAHELWNRRLSPEQAADMTRKQKERGVEEDFAKSADARSRGAIARRKEMRIVDE